MSLAATRKVRFLKEPRKVFTREVANIYGGNYFAETVEVEDDDCPGTFLRYLLIGEKVISQLETWMLSCDTERCEAKLCDKAKAFGQHEVQTAHNVGQKHNSDERELVSGLQSLTKEVQRLQEAQQKVKDEILQKQCEILQEGIKVLSQTKQTSQDAKHMQRRSKTHMKNRLCYRCRCKGHEARNCPGDAARANVLQPMIRRETLRSPHVETVMSSLHVSSDEIALYLLYLYFYPESIVLQFQDNG